jgi:hypothetical protein
MEQTYSLTFEMEERILCYESGKSILLCKESKNGKNLWIKKISDINNISSVIEDTARYYIACETDEIKGFFLAIDRATGATEWFIPGRAYFQVIFDGYLFTIFTDEKNDFFLLKVDCSDGKKIWHHRVNPDLCEYSFRPDRILLTYDSGRAETISPRTGAIIN